MDRRRFCAYSASAAAMALTPLQRMLGAGRDIAAITGSGAPILLAARDVEDLHAGLRGALLLDGDHEYESARRVWNASFDRRPALIARCLDAADVRRSVDFARTHDLLVAVRGGGHSLSGQSVCDGGLMIDLSPMRGVHIDPAARRASVDGGVLLGELDRAAQTHGLATPAGRISHTGIGGLTLGGGYGRLSRKWGLSCDNVVAADVVTADGRLVHASDDGHPDLLWGLKGGGGNFGIVTRFEFALHPIEPMMYGGRIVYPFENGRDVLRAIADYALEAPDEMFVDAAILNGPDGNRFIGLDTCYCGALASAEEVLAPLRALGRPLQDTAGPARYADLQAANDDGSPHGDRYYERSGFLHRIEPALIDEALEHVAGSALPGARILLVHQGGAIARMAPTATPIWHRDAQHSIIVQAQWKDPREDERVLGWARGTWDALESRTNGFYVNTLAEDDPQRRVRGTYGENYERLVALKRRYDPTNLFRRNANIDPNG